MDEVDINDIKDVVSDEEIKDKRVELSNKPASQSV
jgi:hypothetical protein